MLPKITTVKKKWEFQAIINQKKQVISKCIVLYYIPNNHLTNQMLNDLKIGISVPKKFGNAVIRNFNKRQVKEILRQVNFENIKYHYVLILRKTFLSLTYQEKSHEIIKIFERVKSVKK